MNDQAAWLTALKIQPDTYQEWKTLAPKGQSFTYWCLSSGKIPEKNYFGWAIEHYQLPYLMPEFTSAQLDMQLWKNIHTVANWSPWMLPIAQWEDVVLIGCVEPPTDMTWSFQVRFVLATPNELQSVWQAYQNATTAAPDAGPPPPPPAPSAETVEAVETAPIEPEEDNAFEIIVSEPLSAAPAEPATAPEDAAKPEENESAPPPIASLGELDMGDGDGDGGELDIDDAPTGFHVDFKLEPKATEPVEGPESEPEAESEAEPDMPMGLNLNIPKQKIILFGDDEAPAESPSTPSAEPSQKSHVSLDLSAFNIDVDGLSDEQPASTPATAVATAEPSAEPSPGAQATPIPDSPAPETAAELGELTLKRHIVELGEAPQQITDASNGNEAFAWAFKQLKSHFMGSMVLTVEGDSLTAWKWDPMLKPQAQMAMESFSLVDPSLFRIVARTRHPYHGHVVETATHQAFFKSWGFSKPPLHVTAVPLVTDHEVKAIMLSIGEKKCDTLDVLDFAERVCERFWSQLHKGQKSQAA